MVLNTASTCTASWLEACSIYCKASMEFQRKSACVSSMNIYHRFMLLSYKNVLMVFCLVYSDWDLAPRFRKWFYEYLSRLCRLKNLSQFKDNGLNTRHPIKPASGFETVVQSSVWKLLWALGVSNDPVFAVSALQVLHISQHEFDKEVWRGRSTWRIVKDMDN